MQVTEPLRAIVMGAPFEDARPLALCYDRMCQEAEAHVFVCYCYSSRAHFLVMEDIENMIGEVSIVMDFNRLLLLFDPTFLVLVSVFEGIQLKNMV